MSHQSYLALTDITVPAELRTSALELHLAQAAPGDPHIKIVERGTSRREALERLVVEIDRVTVKLYEARRLALEVIQSEESEESKET